MKYANVAFSVVPRIGAGDARIEIEFEVDMVFCFGIRLAPIAFFFHSDLPSTHCTTC